MLDAGQIWRYFASQAMNEDSPTRDEGEDGLDSGSEWHVDRSASRERLRDYDPAAERQGRSTGGWLIYTDEQGAQRRLPADMSELSGREIAGAARASSDELGAAAPSYAKLAAIERLNELHAAGAVSEENYLREKHRLLGLG